MAGTAITSPDAIETYRIAVIRARLKLVQALAASHRSTKSMSPTYLLAAASRVTGKAYRQRQYDMAILDLTETINARKGEQNG
jgi:hypothetical protein